MKKTKKNKINWERREGESKINRGILMNKLSSGVVQDKKVK